MSSSVRRNGLQTAVPSTVQQLQHGVIWSETDAKIAGDSRLLESFAHHLDIGGGIAVGCGDLCVAGPGLDRQKVNARLEKLHGQ